ncbi:MAG: hypothetical protein COA90_08110 [Gammaproteobacteria bacterium]|nr:MAG: hypothetical protein COA90_08110 [Gammaproteobacteria bacterium]
MLKLNISLAILLLLPSLLWAESWQAESGDKQVAVLELFTSEGCGLCPAAEHWVSGLDEQGITEKQLIVLGFHIDYLNDSKGWIDRFASPLFSNRQRQLARINLYDTVYTPEFVLGGEVIHNWDKHVKKGIRTLNNFESEADIVLSVEQKAEQLIIESKLHIEGKANQEHAKLYIAIIEDNIISKVESGDNRGMTFNHQHLVRQWLGPFDLDASGDSTIAITVDKNEQWKSEQLSVVAVVQNLDDGFVLQGLKLALE